MVDFLATWIGAKAVFTWLVNIVKGKPEVAQNQEDSPNATQIHVQGDVSGDVAGRDIDKSVQINVEPPLPQPITPTIDGVINGPNIFVRIENTDSFQHHFKVVFHDVSGMVGEKRVKKAWLPWNCGELQMIGPHQTGIIQVAQADGEKGGFGKVIQINHDKEKAMTGRLSEYVAFGGELYLDLEIQSDAAFGIQARRQWTLVIDGQGNPISFT